MRAEPGRSAGAWEIVMSGKQEPRRLPAPWRVDEIAAAYLVTDAMGRRIAHVYFEDEKSRRDIANLLTKNEARRVAKAIARLPEILPKA